MDNKKILDLNTHSSVSLNESLFRHGQINAALYRRNLVYFACIFATELEDLEEAKKILKKLPTEYYRTKLRIDMDEDEDMARYAYLLAERFMLAGMAELQAPPNPTNLFGAQVVGLA